MTTAPAFEAISSLVFGLTQAVAVQCGVLVVSSSRYIQQVQEEMGLDSAWVRYHRLLIDPDSYSASTMPIEARAAAALRLYRETARLLRMSMQPKDGAVVQHTMGVIAVALDHLQ